MIPKINFTGKVLFTNMAEVFSYGRQSERNKLQKYADENNCDLFVYNRDYYSDYTGVYDAIAVNEDQQMWAVNINTHKNTITTGTIDIKM